MRALVDPVEASAYLNAALEDSQRAFLKAHKNVAPARQMSRVAKDAGIQRETLYHSFSEEGDPPLKTDTDWARVEAITAEELHPAALSDPDAQPFPFGSDEEMAKLRLIHIPNVKKLRGRLGMTQEGFAAVYRIPVGTLRDWEQGRKRPMPPPALI